MVIRRKHEFFVLAAILMMPLAASLFLLCTDYVGEVRESEQPLSEARSWSFSKLPRAVDDYLRSNFGFRMATMRAHAALMEVFGLTSNSRVLRGSDGWLFYRGDEMLQQSSGMLLREDRVVETANTLAAIRDALAARGAKFVVAPAPNSATIYSDKIPGWPARDGSATEYDLLIAQLGRTGVRKIDLRQTLRDAREEGPVYYQYDTHWTPRGALAAYNKIVTETEETPKPMRPAQALGPMSLRSSGDLWPMLNAYMEGVEPAEPLAIFTPSVTRQLSKRPRVFEHVPATGASRTILVLGDSFTEHLFPPLINAGGARAAWMHSDYCRFDWRWIKDIRPDVVWYMPTERLMLCQPGKGPKGIPQAARSADP